MRMRELADCSGWVGWNFWSFACPQSGDCWVRGYFWLALLTLTLNRRQPPSRARILRG